jgi:hypothetical protein
VSANNGQLPAGARGSGIFCTIGDGTLNVAILTIGGMVFLRTRTTGVKTFGYATLQNESKLSVAFFTAAPTAAATKHSAQKKS